MRIRIALIALAVSALACAATDPLHPREKGDGAALGRGGAMGTSDDGGAGPTDDGAAPTPPEAGADAPEPDDAASGGAPDAGADAPVPEGGAPPPPAPPVTYEAEQASALGTTTKIACASCSNGWRVTLAPDASLAFSGVVAPASGTDSLVIYYTSADSKNRSLYVGINGSDSQMLLAVFPPTGGAANVSSIAVPLAGFNAGSNNTVTLFIDTELGAPDIDRIGVLPSVVASGGVGACDRASWKVAASVTGGDGGGPAAAIDGDLTTRWANNRGQNGTDWFQVDFGGLVKLARITLDDSQAFPNDYPGSYAVYGSLDGVTFDATPFATGSGAANATVIDFPQRTVRAIKIAQVGATRSGNWWQIGELTTICYQ
jgi:hypothetical protein